jgi:hypothetical protein
MVMKITQIFDGAGFWLFLFEHGGAAFGDWFDLKGANPVAEPHQEYL